MEKERFRSFLHSMRSDIEIRVMARVRHLVHRAKLVDEIETREFIKGQMSLFQ